MTRKALCNGNTVLFISANREIDAQVETACATLKDWAAKSSPSQRFEVQDIEVVTNKTDFESAVGKIMFKAVKGE